jgi:hypothetical protein
MTYGCVVIRLNPEDKPVDNEECRNMPAKQEHRGYHSLLGFEVSLQLNQGDQLVVTNCTSGRRQDV